MRVLVTPRDNNPYQRLLYQQVEKSGLAVRYVEGPTGSQTLNLLLLPLFLAAQRCRGARVLHLHWVYNFAIPIARRLPSLRRAAQAWFYVVLQAARCLGYRIVWTAHNVLPHERTFHDDLKARRALVRRADAVIVHSEHTRRQLQELGMTPRVCRRIGHGSYRGVYPQSMPRATARQALGLGPDDVVLLFFGTVAPYKGVDLLVEAFAKARTHDDAKRLRLVIAGPCRDPDYANRVVSLAATVGTAVQVDLSFIPVEEVQVYMNSADIAVLPFRQLTTSGSVLLAMTFGLGVLVPDIPPLTDVPAAACIRYSAWPDALSDTIRRLSEIEPATLRAMSQAASRYAEEQSWEKISALTVALYEEIL